MNDKIMQIKEPKGGIKWEFWRADIIMHGNVTFQ